MYVKVLYFMSYVLTIYTNKYFIIN